MWEWAQGGLWVGSFDETKPSAGPGSAENWSKGNRFCLRNPYFFPLTRVCRYGVGSAP